MIDLPQFARMCGVTNINVSILERYGIHPVATKAIGQKRLVNLYLKSDADRYNAEISLATKRTKKESEVVSDKDTSVSKAELVALIMKMNARLDAIENGIANVLP